NGQLVEVEKASVMDRLEPLTKKYFDEFYLCSNCGGLFWKGSHYDRMSTFVAQVMDGHLSDRL
ncbi:MAG: Mut7-C RNAse domain-containing protein, partial [Bacteroidota bacterium]|nr:Mut7-C RNAse domain-containing protein [Bacteroidota bacterium]